MRLKIHSISVATTRWCIRVFVPLGAVCLLAAAFVNTANATVYRWVDDEGKTHYSETVPHYRRTAEAIDAPANNPTAEQRREALMRAQKEKDAAAAIDADKQRFPSSPQPASSAQKPVVKRPTETPSSQTSCETWQRLYEESMACFGSFRTEHGSTQEAFEICNVVAEPPIDRCRWLIP